MNRLTWGAVVWLGSVVALLSFGEMRFEAPSDRAGARAEQLGRAIDFACRQTQLLGKPVLVSFEPPNEDGARVSDVPLALGAALARFQLLALPITEENADFVRYFGAASPTWLVLQPRSCNEPIADWPPLARRAAPAVDSTARLEEAVSWLEDVAESNEAWARVP